MIIPGIEKLVYIPFQNCNAYINMYMMMYYLCCCAIVYFEYNVHFGQNVTNSNLNKHETADEKCMKYFTIKEIPNIVVIVCIHVR